MILKAGTYRFNDVLTELIFEQSIDITTTAEDNGTIATVKISKLAGVQGDNFALVGLFYSIVIDGEEQLNEETPMVVYGGAQKDYWHLPLQTHTIAKDTEVNDTFGTWYIANTNYNEVNSTSVLGLRKFNETVESNGNDYGVGELLQNTELSEQIWNSSFIEITPISREIDGVSVILEGFTVFFTSSDSAYPNMPCTLCKIKYTEQSVLVPVHFNNLFDDDFIPSLLGGFNVTATANGIVDEWILANTKAVEITKKFTRLYLGEVAYSSNGKRFRKLQTEEYVEPSLRFKSNGDGTCYVTGLGSYTDPNIVIPSVSPDGDTVTGIDDYSLMSYQTIKSVTIPNTITFIGTEAFYNCESLKSVAIGSGVTHIRSKAFFGCSLLNNITFNGTVEQWNAIRLGISWKYYVPAEFVQCTNGRVWLGEKISDLRNTTWHFASGWTAPKGYGVFSVRVQVTRSNSEVLISNGIAVGFEYQNDINNIPSVGNVIYLPTGSINIYSNEAIDVYFVDSGYDTDITNTDLIDWLYTYGELKTETL